MSKQIVMFSGGIGSWCATERLLESFDSREITLLFTDTETEDYDLYRFLDESAKYFDCELVKIADGRNVWEVFEKERCIGNSRMDPCSKILKRQMATQWVRKNCHESDVLVFGIDWTEQHRSKAIEERWQPYFVSFPLLQTPFLSREQMIDAVAASGIKLPRLYSMGFPHNNCGGFCVKAGIAHFKLLLEKLPERYRYHEEQEQRMRKILKKDVSILRDRRGGKTKPLTLKDLRLRLCEQPTLFTDEEWGGCGCFT